MSQEDTKTEEKKSEPAQEPKTKHPGASPANKSAQQKKASEMMGISQQSFSRIVREARKKLSDAIVNAKIIKIEGGNFINKRSHDLANKIKRRKINVK